MENLEELAEVYQLASERARMIAADAGAEECASVEADWTAKAALFATKAATIWSQVQALHREERAKRIALP